MLISTTVKLKWVGRTKNYYIDLGYKFTKIGDEFEVNINHLTKGSNVYVKYQCDNCHNIITDKYCNYNRYVREGGKTYCNNCANKLFGKEKIRKAMLKKSISFGQWALDNNLFNHIDLEKNKEENIDVFSIGCGSHIKIWFKCLNTDYHGSYKKYVNSFVKGTRCPFCSNQKIHPKDSLAQSMINDYGLKFFNKIWNWEKNNELGINPWKIAPSSEVVKVWWNCLNNKNHEPYLRTPHQSKQRNYKCPNCTIYTGEVEVENILLKHNIEYKTQYKFNDCKCSRCLPFDFYLPDYNILIEYDGEQHFKPIRFKGVNKDESLDKFIITKIHDTIKTIYAKNNNIKLIRIPYYEFDNIEKILIRELNLSK